MSTAKVTCDTVTDGFLLTVGDYLGGQFSTPLVELFVAEVGPIGPRAKPVDLLVSIGDETNQIVTGGNEGSHVVVHRENRLSAVLQQVNTFFNLLARSPQSPCETASASLAHRVQDPEDRSSPTQQANPTRWGRK